MFSEWSELVKTLRSLERRIEILQIHRDLDDQNKSVVAVSTATGGELPNRHYYRDDYDDTAGGNTKSVDHKVSLKLSMIILN